MDIKANAETNEKQTEKVKITDPKKEVVKVPETKVKEPEPKPSNQNSLPICGGEINYII